MTHDEKINLIGQKILVLSNNLDKYRTELAQLQAELLSLKAEKTADHKTAPVVEETKKEEPSKKVLIEEIKSVITEEPLIEKLIEEIRPDTKKPSLSFEEKIGSRWFSIIGIVVLVLGVAIGVKYAIDKDLIDETTRLVMGFLAGGILLTFALAYKKKYDVFSAILLSGAMAIMYFTTFIGYSYYHIFGAVPAFLIMALFTGFTVFAAHVYNNEVIALIGLVGGYALPPLLSTGSGEIQYMFAFMLILNLGILALSFKKYWKFVNHVAYALSWLIFAIWMAAQYKPELYFTRTMFFSTAFYLIFYLSFISYKIFRNKPFSAWDVILVLSNSLIYFGIGYNAMQNDHYEQYQGLFCVMNALFHLGFALLCRKKEVSDKTIFYFIIAMVISFITLAIPVQLDGNYVTLIWLSEMIVLMWMSKKTNVSTYKYLAYGISLLAFCSLWHDWTLSNYFSENLETVLALTPIMNRYFVSSLIGTTVFGFAWFLNRKMLTDQLSKVANVFLIIMGLIICYMTFANEIIMYFNIHYKLSEAKHLTEYGYEWTYFDEGWQSYSGLWMINYSIVFLTVLSWLSLKKFANKVFAYVCWSFNLLMAVIGFAAGLVIIHELKLHAVNDDPYAAITTWNYNCRYLFLPFAALLIFMIYQFRNSELLKNVRSINYWFFHIMIIILLSDELQHITTMLHLDNYDHYSKVATRMGFTVLWGLYSMSLITYGILRKRKMLRIIAISLFGLTILKLASDAMNMTMGYRLIVFMVIGIILLVVSFMYQKFKPLLVGEPEQQININSEINEGN
jgi:uncharacterized membrane protein